MRQQREHGDPFVWICNTNKGVAKVSLAALRNLGIAREDIERDGFPGDPSVKGSLPILARPGVWIRLTRNLDKARGFVNGALGQVDQVLRDDEDVVVFSLRLLSGTMVLVHPICFHGKTFLPCVYGYGCTVRRTQGLSLWHGALFLDGEVYPRPRGHGYVAVSRFRRAKGVFHYGPLRRSDWLPTARVEGEQDRPGDLSPRHWDHSDSEDSNDFEGGFGRRGSSDSESQVSQDGFGGGMDCSESESDSSAGGFGGRRRGSSDSESEESRYGFGGASRASTDSESTCFASRRLSVVDSGEDEESDAESSAEVRVGFRCASPDPLAVVCPEPADSDEEPSEPADSEREDFSECEELPRVEDAVVRPAPSPSSLAGFGVPATPVGLAPVGSAGDTTPGAALSPVLTPLPLARRSLLVGVNGDAPSGLMTPPCVSLREALRSGLPPPLPPVPEVEVKEEVPEEDEEAGASEDGASVGLVSLAGAFARSSEPRAPVAELGAELPERPSDVEAVSAVSATASPAGNPVPASLASLVASAPPEPEDVEELLDCCVFGTDGIEAVLAPSETPAARAPALVPSAFSAEASKDACCLALAAAWARVREPARAPLDHGGLGSEQQELAAAEELVAEFDSGPGAGGPRTFAELDETEARGCKRPRVS